MFRSKKTKIRLVPSIDTPPAHILVGTEIARNPRSPVATEAAQEGMQAAKRTPTPSLTQIVEQKTWENGQLRQDLERKHSASLYLLEEVKLVVESLQQAILNFQRLNTELEDDVGRT
jgi:hypothetical protein